LKLSTPVISAGKQTPANSKSIIICMIAHKILNYFKPIQMYRALIKLRQRVVRNSERAQILRQFMPRPPNINHNMDPPKKFQTVSSQSLMTGEIMLVMISPDQSVTNMLVVLATL